MGSHHVAGPCHRCGRGGHLARECSLHICFRCNGKGHMAWECVEGVTCSRCGERGHLQRNCKNVSCHKCGRKGHISKFCNDPFIKAEEAERHERQQALLRARIAPGHGMGKGEFTSLNRATPTATGTQKGAPGPWDGLGNRGQERTFSETRTSKGGVAIGKIGTNRSEGAVLEKVKILTVKRKIYPQANTARTKRHAHDSTDDREADMGGNSKSTPICKDVMKYEEPTRWNGLVGYSSGDSREDRYTSSDVDSEGQTCSSNEHVHLTFASSARGGEDRDTDNYAISLQLSVKEPPKDSTNVSKLIVEDCVLPQANISDEL